MKVTRTLPCLLTEDEINERGQLLATSELELTQLKEELKETQREYKENIKAQESIVFKLASEVNEGSEQREVQCEWVYHAPRRGMKQLVRLDTNEVVDEKDMTDVDKQRAADAMQLKIA